jgi:regulation of enolase protein 1 (concanavalin A-like superfamily)
MEWLNEPPSWEATGDLVTVFSGAKTDFWRKTHDGEVRDNGHFYSDRVTGDFRAEVLIQGEYRDLYDQAGLMVRVDETTWLKCGIELVKGVQHVSAVVTREFSDWSVVPLPGKPAGVWIRVTRHEGTFEVRYALGPSGETLLRQAFLTTRPSVSVGIMSASPTGGGFPTRFQGFCLHV